MRTELDTAAPVALAQSVTAVAIAKGVAASGSTLILIKATLELMAWITNAMFRNNTRNRAAGLLGALKLAPEIAVPALTQGLADSNPTVAETCAWSLVGFGPEAKSAIPMLLKAAESTNAQVNAAARRALEQIEKA